MHNPEWVRRKWIAEKQVRLLVRNLQYKGEISKVWLGWLDTYIRCLLFKKVRIGSIFARLNPCRPYCSQGFNDETESAKNVNAVYVFIELN